MTFAGRSMSARSAAIGTPGDADVAWIPELVTIRVRSPSGATVDLKTVRLMHRPQQ